MADKINIGEKFALFSEHWRPKVLADVNGQEFKIVKLQGEFPWHFHANADEFFMVWKGEFRIEFRDRVVKLAPGECLVVPRGVEHRTAADAEAEVMVFAAAGERNTGDVEHHTFTAPDGVHI